MVENLFLATISHKFNTTKEKRAVRLTTFAERMTNYSETPSVVLDPSFRSPSPYKTQQLGDPLIFISLRRCLVNLPQFGVGVLDSPNYFFFFASFFWWLVVGETTLKILSPIRNGG